MATVSFVEIILRLLRRPAKVENRERTPPLEPPWRPRRRPSGNVGAVPIAATLLADAQQSQLPAPDGVGRAMSRPMKCSFRKQKNSWSLTERAAAHGASLDRRRVGSREGAKARRGHVPGDVGATGIPFRPLQDANAGWRHPRRNPFAPSREISILEPDAMNPTRSC